MHVNKIVRVLIVIFFALSVLFLALFQKELEKRTLLSQELVNEAVYNLASRGVVIQPEDIVREVPERDIYSFSLDNEELYYDSIVKSISDICFDAKIVLRQFDTPEGSSIAIYDKASDERELGRILFSDTDTSFVFSKQGFSMSDIEKTIDNGQTAEIGADAKQVIQTFFEMLSTNTRLSYKITGSSEGDDVLVVSALQSIDDTVISNSYMNFVFRDNELVMLSGKLVLGNPKPTYHNTLTDGVNILYKLDLENISSVTEQKIVYKLVITDDNMCYLIPYWWIEYTDKSGKPASAYFDAV